MTDAPPLDRLRALIASDEALQTRLAEFTDRHDFAPAAAEAAAQAGVAIEADTVLNATWGDPAGMDQFDQTPPNATGWPARGYLPSGVIETQGGLAVGWNHFGGARLVESFYHDSLSRSRGRPLNRLMKLRTPLGTLLEPRPADAAQDAPDALVFHMSRCGSTLVGRMLAALPGTVVLSEPAPLDALVQLVHTHPQVPLEERVGLLRGMVAALGRDRHGDKKRLIIKTDSWHSLALPLFRAAFPDTPWIFLFRDPVEVMVSQMRARGSQTVPGIMADGLYGISNADSIHMTAENYIAHVLAAVNEAAIDHAGLGGGIFVDYAELPGAMESRILPHFGISPGADELALLRAATERDAKSTAMTFTRDNEQKHKEATDAIRAAVAEHLDPVHRRLIALATG